MAGKGEREGEREKKKIIIIMHSCQQRLLNDYRLHFL